MAVLTLMLGGTLCCAAVRSGDRPGRPRTLPLRRLRCGAHDAPPDRRPRRPGPERGSRCTTHRRQRRRSAGTRARAGGLGFLRPALHNLYGPPRPRTSVSRRRPISRRPRTAPGAPHSAPCSGSSDDTGGALPSAWRAGSWCARRPDRRLHRRHPTLRRRRLPRHRRPWASRRTRPAARLRRSDSMIVSGGENVFPRRSSSYFSTIRRSRTRPSPRSTTTSSDSACAHTSSRSETKPSTRRRFAPKWPTGCRGPGCPATSSSSTSSPGDRQGRSSAARSMT